MEEQTLQALLDNLKEKFNLVIDAAGPGCAAQIAQDGINLIQYSKGDKNKTLKSLEPAA